MRTGPPSLNVSFSAAERAMSDSLMTAFAAFARGGAPGTPDWRPFDGGNRSGLVINVTAAAGPLGTGVLLGVFSPEVMHLAIAVIYAISFIWLMMSPIWRRAPE